MQSRIRLFFSVRLLVRKTLSPQTIGDEWPSPGTAILQAIFSVLLHLVGMPFPVLTPSPLDPRQPGQFSARINPATKKNNTTKRMPGV